MSHAIYFAFWFFIPAGIANMAPIFAAHIPYLNRLKYPMDFNILYKGKRILGDHKTWRGFFLGTIMGIVTVYIQQVLFIHSSYIRSISYPINYHTTDTSSQHILLLGALLGMGALLGDAIESALKRHRNIHSGDTWFPFDQLDYVIGGIVLSLFYVRLPLTNYIWIVVLWFLMHLLFSYIGYRLKLKDKPL